ncbi:hypothetical protein M8J77_019261 [Diaphorina citri]|nr:hypothetical protein M8J77_019261 [Diaphorina citri]
MRLTGVSFFLLLTYQETSSESSIWEIIMKGLILYPCLVLFCISQVSGKPFFWGDRLYYTTKQPLLKKAFSKFNHWFKNLIDAYPSSTWSWREHIYGQTYWKDPVIKKAWYYKGVVEDWKSRNPPKKVIFNQYDIEKYKTTVKPGVQEDIDLDYPISRFRRV